MRAVVRCVLAVIGIAAIVVAGPAGVIVINVNSFIRAQIFPQSTSAQNRIAVPKSCLDDRLNW